jgi:hypothetical protein
MREHHKEKQDPADGNDPKETFLPGQIPVTESEEYPETGPEGEERQIDPVGAEQAVNPELQPVKERKPA